MPLHTSIPGGPGEPRRGATVVCVAHPESDVDTATVEALDRAQLVTRTTWTCRTCHAPLTPETTP